MEEKTGVTSVLTPDTGGQSDFSCKFRWAPPLTSLLTPSVPVKGGLIPFRFHSDSEMFTTF